jgi:hypothetical protein
MTEPEALAVLVVAELEALAVLVVAEPEVEPEASVGTQDNFTAGVSSNPSRAL